MPDCFRTSLCLSLLLFTSSCVVNEAFAGEICKFEDGMTFENWQSWQKLTRRPIFSQGHGSTWVDIYVNELAEEIYRNAGGLYPTCAKIVKAAYDDEEGKEFWSLNVMVKMPPGYDPENGDWWYANYQDDTGIKPVQQGKLFNKCIACHKAASETDYLFSKQVMAEINKD